MKSKFRAALTIFVLMGVCMASTATGDFRAEKINLDDMAALMVARQKFNAAQDELTAVESRIKAKFGQTQPSNFSTTSCIQGWTDVELRGEWALITRNVWNLCEQQPTTTLTAPTTVKTGKD